MKPNILHDRPDQADATGFRGKGIDLIGALSNVAKEALNGVGCLNIPMHHRWKGIKCEQMLLIFTETADRFGIALGIFGFERRQIDLGLLLALLFPNSHQFGLHLLAFPTRDRTEDIALLMD